MSDDTDAPTRFDDCLLADDVLTDVIGGETGDRMRAAVASAITDLRGMDPDEMDDAVYELADVDSVFPYTYDRVQAFAESIHHATYGDDITASSMSDNAMDAVSVTVGAILLSAIRVAADRIVEVQA